MEHVLSGINSLWWWWGPALLVALFSLLIYELVGFVRGEIRWWKKKRDYERFINE